MWIASYTSSGFSLIHLFFPATYFVYLYFSNIFWYQKSESVILSTLELRYRLKDTLQSLLSHYLPLTQTDIPTHTSDPHPSLDALHQTLLYCIILACQFTHDPLLFCEFIPYITQLFPHLTTPIASFIQTTLAAAFHELSVYPSMYFFLFPRSLCFPPLRCATSPLPLRCPLVCNPFALFTRCLHSHALPPHAPQSRQH